jgi:hypothetical protein
MLVVRSHPGAWSGRGQADSHALRAGRFQRAERMAKRKVKA